MVEKEARKLTFDEVVASSTPFYNDENLEREFDAFLEELSRDLWQRQQAWRTTPVNLDNVVRFCREEKDGLVQILRKVHLSQEKFMRIISSLRLRGHITGDFRTEWKMDVIERRIKLDDEFATKLASIFINGREHPQLILDLPLFYREGLTLQGFPYEPDLSRLKAQVKERPDIRAKYNSMKGKAIEGLIKAELERAKTLCGVGYDAGKTELVDVRVDWAVPNLQDPYVIVMSSYLETTSSGQSSKQRDMSTCYQDISRSNIQRHENRVFVNFVDGAGWLARQSDLRRLVDGCHYFLNIKHLAMLEGIILKHVPKKYFTGKTPPS